MTYISTYLVVMDKDIIYDYDVNIALDIELSNASNSEYEIRTFESLDYEFCGLGYLCPNMKDRFIVDYSTRIRFNRSNLVYIPLEEDEHIFDEEIDLETIEFEYPCEDEINDLD